MNTVYGEVGQIIAAGAPIGLMDGPATDSADFVAPGSDGGGAGGSETLYLEVRQGVAAVDPAEWFTGMQEQDGSR
jgi:septal ring factor EnvC (AmiA/AmiB activator)